jgi:hypothetical protein
MTETAWTTRQQAATPWQRRSTGSSTLPWSTYQQPVPLFPRTSLMSPIDVKYSNVRPLTSVKALLRGREARFRREEAGPGMVHLDDQWGASSAMCRSLRELYVCSNQFRAECNCGMVIPWPCHAPSTEMQSISRVGRSAYVSGLHQGCQHFQLTCTSPGDNLTTSHGGDVRQAPHRGFLLCSFSVPALPQLHALRVSAGILGSRRLVAARTALHET